MSDKEVALVYADDWVGLYVDGEVEAQGHRLGIPEVLEKLGIQPVVIWAEDYLHEHGLCPQKLSDVVPDKDQ